MPTAICFIERLQHHRRLDAATNTWESGNWDVAADKAERLVGKRIYFHDKQAEPSYFGGTITGYRVLANDHPESPGRIVFVFIANEQGRGFLAGKDGWRFEQKTIAE